MSEGSWYIYRGRYTYLVVSVGGGPWRRCLEGQRQACLIASVKLVAESKRKKAAHATLSVVRVRGRDGHREYKKSNEEALSPNGASCREEAKKAAGQVS